jgi:hypothetical protein
MLRIFATAAVLALTIGAVQADPAVTVRYAISTCRALQAPMF